MKKGWEVQRLEDCFKLKSGDGLTSKMMADNGDYSVFGGNGIAGMHNDYNLSGSNVIIGRVGALCGNVRHMNEEIWLTDNAFKVVDFKYEFDHSFLTYLLNFKNLREYARQAAQPVISNSSLKDVILNFPKSLQEQQRIVAILDEAFIAIEKAKANAQQNLQNAKELFESYLQNTFSQHHRLKGLKENTDATSKASVTSGSSDKIRDSDNGEVWEEKTLAQISETFGRGKSKHRPRNFAGLYNGAYPFIQTGDIRNCDHFITDYTQTYNELGLAQSKLWPTGTICITIAANIAETGILTFDACFPDSVIGIVVNKKLAERDFVEYLLQSFKVRIQALGKGSAQANINMGTFENEHFPFPPLKTQQTIVKKLDALSAETKKLEAIYQQKVSYKRLLVVNCLNHRLKRFKDFADDDN
jgi:type I restriction enzyme S subunit